MQAMSRRPIRAALTVVALATVTLLGTATGALACTTDDNRAHPTPGQVDTCKQIREGGDTLGPENFTSELSKDKKSLKITALGEGVTVTAVVVNGGDDGRNVYYVGGDNKLQLSNLPWEKLRAPFNYNGSQPTVGKWFACGTKKTPPVETSVPTKPSSPTTKPTEGKPTETSKPAPTEGTATPTESSSPTTTVTPAVVPAGNGTNGGGLAATGFENGWLIWVGALLLLAGGGVLTLLKIRRKAS